MKKQNLLILCSLFVFFVSVRIEVLNYRVGTFLPRQKLSTGGYPKWRSKSIKAAELNWVYNNSINGRNTGKELGPEKLRELELYLADEKIKIDTWNRLRFWCASFGTLQYLLAPTCLLFMIWSVKDSRHRSLLKKSIQACTVLLLLLSISLAVYREYYTVYLD
ncbi:hypothetical protein [Gimesia sp.]|uniref:hypothetical protein n=1 Tax=Gimesia sp. TaxID=2024833 RepID=UPI003A955235